MARCWVTYLDFNSDGTNASVLLRFTGPDVDPEMAMQTTSAGYEIDDTLAQIQETARSAALVKAAELGLSLNVRDIFVQQYLGSTPDLFQIDAFQTDAFD